MDISELYNIKNETERVEALYEIFDEDRRLNTSNSSRIEFLTTIKYIEEKLKNGSEILDLGAGTGVYSIYFAEKGYSVTAVELAKDNIEAFRPKIKSNMDLELIHGNALDLSYIADKKFDIVLLFGPLYHLEQEEDINKCIQEALRVLKDDGTIFISFINNDMIPLTELNFDPDYFVTGIYNRETFKLENFPFVFFSIDECRAMLVNSGIRIEKEIASDGFAELLEDKINKMDDENFVQYLKYHLYYCEKKEFLGATNHFLFSGKKAKE